MSFPHVSICSVSAHPQHQAGREDESLKEDNLPLTEWTKVLLATCWHLLKELSMFTTTELSIYYCTPLESEAQTV